MKTTFYLILATASFAGMVASGATQCYPLVLVAMAGMIAVTLAAMSRKADQMAQARSTK